MPQYECTCVCVCVRELIFSDIPQGVCKVSQDDLQREKLINSLLSRAANANRNARNGTNRKISSIGLSTEGVERIEQRELNREARMKAFGIRDSDDNGNKNKDRQEYEALARLFDLNAQAERQGDVSFGYFLVFTFHFLSQSLLTCISDAVTSPRYKLDIHFGVKS